MTKLLLCGYFYWAGRGNTKIALKETDVRIDIDGKKNGSD